jgi:predicted glycogen debranching enzyme
MSELVRATTWRRGESSAEALVTREWLVTNGLGGYASGTVGGVCTRRYHGLLIAALPVPLGRAMMLSHLSEQVRLPGHPPVRLGGEESESGALELHGAAHLEDFRLERGLPVWRYELAGFVVEKRLFMPHLQNTVHVMYRLLACPTGRGPLRLTLRPAVHFRGHDEHVSEQHPGPYTLSAVEERYQLSAAPPSLLPPLRLRLRGARPAFTLEPRWLPDVRFRIEESRGYQSTGRLYSPGFFRADLAVDQAAALVASTEGWEIVAALAPEEAHAAELARRERLVAAAQPAAQRGVAAELVLAADQFIVTPEARVA